MRPMAIPSVGGMSIQLITLFIAPCIYCMVQELQYRRWIAWVENTNPEILG